MSDRQRININSPNFEEVVTQWYNELEDQPEPAIEDTDDTSSWPDDSEDDNDQIISGENSDLEYVESEQELDSTDDQEEQDNIQSVQYYIGKDKCTKWKKQCPPLNSRTRSNNIVLRLPGPIGEARNAKSDTDCLNLLLTDDVITIITHCTNIYITKIAANFKRGRDANLTSNEEIKGCIGILYLAGVLKAGRQNLFQIWDNSRGIGIEAIYLAMSLNRFRFLIRCLRFDDVNTRQQRKEFDKLAPIRELFESLIKNFQANFTPSQYLTIDEQLVAFRGRCQFRQYIPSKPSKYGIKIFALVDVKNAYTYNMEIYCGKQPDGPFQVSSSAAEVVKRMVKRLEGTGRNITMDNWFTSVPLALDLLQKKLTIIGTIRKNKRELPEEFVICRNRQINSSLFGYHKEKCTLVSYTPKKSKVVLALSTMHHDMSIDGDTGEKRKPEIITSYNKTKGGVDLVDQLCAQYDVSRNSRRWPLTIFFDLLNICAINAYSLFKANNVTTTIRRREFLQDIALQLLNPLMKKRLESSNTPSHIKLRIKTLLKIEDERPRELYVRNSTIGRCHICGRGRNKSTRKWCSTCNQWTCPGHLKQVCFNCTEEGQSFCAPDEDL